MNEILDQSNLLWSSWQLLFLVPPLQPHYPNRNHGAGGAQGALKNPQPPRIQHGKGGKPAPLIDLVLLSASHDFDSFAIDTAA